MKFLSGNRLLLRAVEPEDVALIYRWENDSSSWGDGCALSPYSRYAIRTYIEESLRQDIFQMRQLRFMIVRASDGVAVGMVDLFDFDPYHRRAAVGIYVDAASRGQGIAGEALNVLCCYAFDFLHLHQLYAQVAESNEAVCTSLRRQASGRADGSTSGLCVVRGMSRWWSCSGWLPGE